MDAYECAFDHEALNSVIGSLQKAFFSQEPVPTGQFESSYKKAAWIATFLANSNSHEHRQKALLFAALSKMVLPERIAIETLCYTIFARTGTLPAAMHLKQIAGDKQEYKGPSLGPLSIEFLVSYIQSYSTLAGGIILTEFQKNAVDSLLTNSCGIISAPTSAGKSFIIHEYVKNKLATEENFLALFIVPTKALIAQTCAIYRKFKVQKEVDFSVYSSVAEDLEISTSNAVFALTQERCIRLLSSSYGKRLSFIFIDEIQSLESGERGALLEYVLHELTSLSPKAQSFAAGPFIANTKQLGENLFIPDCPSIETKDSPVSQMVVQVTPVSRSTTLKLRVVDSSSPEHDFCFDIPVNEVFYSKWKTSQTKAISDAITLFSSKSPSIVYAPGQGTAQNWAKEHIEDLSDDSALPREMADLIVYLKESIHPQCSLIRCLSRRIAYHHAGLPDFVREEIEELFSQRLIDVLFCTSTLLEGVNLPADKIFIVSPKKADELLSPFEFKNLIGRAGRLNEHLCGVVYCVQVPNDDQEDWINKFRGDTQKEVKPTTDEKFASSFHEIEKILQEGMPLLPENDESNLRGTITILRSRFLQNRKHASNYLARKKMTPEQQQSLLEALDKSMSALSIPSELALRNPYIDPILQDQLYQKVVISPKEWIIRSRFGFAIDLEKVFKELDSIFHIIQEIKPIGNPSYYRSNLLTFAKLWLHGKPFKDIVIRALPSKHRNSRDVPSHDVDTAIKKAMDFITKDISFVTAKYFSVLAEIIKAVVPVEEQGDFAMTIGLPSMLELGCSDSKALALVTACIPRGAAIKIAPRIPDEVEDPVVWLTLHQKDDELQKLPSIYHKILKRTGIWG